MRKTQNIQCLLLLLIGTLFSDAISAIKLRLESEPETCGMNIQRMQQQKDQVAYINKIKDTNETYQDINFPASRSSLFWSNHHRKDRQLLRQYNQKIMKWARPSQIIHYYNQNDKTTPSLWGKGGIDPSDSGTPSRLLKDGWFLGSVASLAEHKDNIYKIFAKNANYTKSGAFELQFFVNGLPQSVVIDDQLPMLNETMPANTGPSLAEGWWLPLLEKAYAKLNVNFENLNRGGSLNQIEALRALTGAPVESMDVKDPMFIQKLQEYLDANYSISAYVERNSGKTYGLRRRMSYNILEINDQSTDDAAKDGIKNQRYTLLLRDPWTGGNPVSFQGTEKDPDAQAFDNPAEETFEMTDKKFQEVFSSVNVAMTSPKWKILHQTFKKDTDKKFLLEIDNPTDQELIVTVDYLTPRMYAPNCEEKSNVRYSLQLKKKSMKGPANDRIIDQVPVNKKISYGILHVHELPKGTYEVKVVRSGDHEQAKEFTVSVYTSDAPVKELSKFHLLMSSLDAAHRKNKTDIFESKPLDGKVTITSYLDEDISKLTVLVEKQESILKQTLSVTVQVKCKGGLPKKLQSNINWKNGLHISEESVTDADKTMSFYNIQLQCPGGQAKCIYVIPKAKKFYKILLKDDIVQQSTN